MIHKEVGWVEQTASAVGLRSLALESYNCGLSYRVCPVCDDPL